MILWHLLLVLEHLCPIMSPEFLSGIGHCLKGEAFTSLSSLVHGIAHPSSLGTEICSSVETFDTCFVAEEEAEMTLCIKLLHYIFKLSVGLFCKENPNVVVAADAGQRHLPGGNWRHYQERHYEHFDSPMLQCFLTATRDNTGNSNTCNSLEILKNCTQRAQITKSCPSSSGEQGFKLPRTRSRGQQFGG